MGVVTEVGDKVEKFKVGDKVGVGALLASCRNCDMCAQGLEVYCARKIFSTGAIDTDGNPTHGGFCDLMVADEHYVIRWPENLPMDAGAPLLCAGISTYSPLIYF